MRAICGCMKSQILTDIETFLAETGMSERAFARAVGNGALFQRLRTVGKRGNPGRVWPETDAHIRAFMTAERQRRAASPANKQKLDATTASPTYEKA